VVRFPTFYLNLEGPDRSGKTTIFSMIHKHTGYRWNIHDRSAISMLTYAKLYERDTFHNIENLKRELFNLNNRFIILYPSWETIYQRQIEAPDDIHDVIALKKVYSMFGEVVEEFQNYPNVIVVNHEEPREVVPKIVNSLIKIESYSFKQIQEQVLQLACVRNGEAIGVNFTLFDNGEFSDVDESVLEYEKEKEYYQKIRVAVKKKIQNEIESGQQLKSRRFVYTDDSCISLANFNYRNNILDCNIVLRSSDVKDTLYYDLNFAGILCRDVFKQLNLNSAEDFCRIRFEINSAHIPSMVN